MTDGAKANAKGDASEDVFPPSMTTEERQADVRRAADEAKAARVAELSAILGATVAGRYQVTRLIGLGGMGAVYEAEHVGIGKKVAIKFIDRDHAQMSQVASRFAREARAASAIDSEHIVSVFDAGTEDDRPYIVMELLRGEDLGRRLKRRGKLPLGETMHIVTQVLRGLADAHEAGIVHRDLKPDNVFLLNKRGDESFVKIVDFGISKIEKPENGTAPLALTRAGTVLGTPLYMAPEQAQAVADLDARADLYSVGAILFECLAGRPPHVGETYEQIIVSICMRDAPDIRTIEPSVPYELSRVITRALARERRDRYSSARQMLVALTDVVSASPTERQPATSGPPTLLAGGVERGTPVTGPMSPVVTAIGPHGSSLPPLPALRSSAPTPTVRVAETPIVDVAPPPAVQRTDVSWSSGSRPQVSLPSGKRKSRVGMIVVTGLVATLAGAALTIWGVSALRTPEVGAVGESIGINSLPPATIAPPPSITPVESAPSATVVTSATAPATAAGTAAKKPPSRPTASTTTTATATAPPKKNPDGLDLQRDFH